MWWQVLLSLGVGILLCIFACLPVWWENSEEEETDHADISYVLKNISPNDTIIVQPKKHSKLNYRQLGQIMRQLERSLGCKVIIIPEELELVEVRYKLSNDEGQEVEDEK